MQKYFISHDNLKSQIIDGDDAFHIIKVMRSRIGDEILVSDQNKTFLAKIKSFDSNKVLFEIIEEKTNITELPVFVSIFQGYPKGDKLDDIIKHGTELGVYEFYPTLMKRSIFKLEEKKKESKLLRFNKIAKEASEQSYREYIPKVVDILDLKKIDFSNYDYKIYCYEEAAKENESANFKKIVSNLKKNDKVAIVIGPEGGLEEDDVKNLKNNGAEIITLGKRILRCETAAIYFASIVSFYIEKN